jgi:hypothetical protein
MDSSIGIRRRYHKAELEVRVRGLGFRIERSRYLNWIGAIGWYVNARILGRKSVPTRQLRIFDSLLGFLNATNWFSNRFGLSILLIATKEKMVR